jgi:uncharacterized protein YceK
MRISHLLAALFICSLVLGCGSVNRRQTPQQKAARINPHDPMMSSNYLKTRTVP